MYARRYLRDVPQGLGNYYRGRGERLLGVISDGDLRRLLEKRGKDFWMPQRPNA